jgi:hypothetical protein
MSARLAAVANALLVVAVVVWNYWTAAFGFAGKTVGGLSDAYDTLFTPAGYAFSIWGLIFLGQIAHAGYQLRLAFGERADERDAFFRDLGPWMLVTNVLNIAWTAVWLSEWTAASVAILSLMNVCLFVVMRRLRMEVWDAPLRIIALVWWPLVIYAGWVAVAVLANLSAFLAKEGRVPGDSAAWAIAMIAVATLYNLAMVRWRNLREHALVAVWAFVAIAVKQAEGSRPVFVAALVAAGLLVVVVAVHAFRSRATLPLVGKPGRSGA